MKQMNKQLTFLVTLTILTSLSIVSLLSANPENTTYKTNPYQKKSISSHLEHLQSCGVNKENIDVKRDSDINSSIPLIVYVVQSESIDLECQLNSELKSIQTLKNKVPSLFKSLHDSGEAETTYPLAEGLVKIDDRIVIFTAPDSDIGVTEINLISNEYIIVRVKTHTHSRNFLVSIDSLYITHLSDGQVSVVDPDKLLFKVSGRKTYFKDFGGPFWYDALIDKKGLLIDIVSVEDKKRIDKCYPKNELLNKSYIELELPNPTQEEICVER
tara:strand:+ start:604 stop:1416 length:813 start_codon:yes stop_codon:yes gene_type:complete